MSANKKTYRQLKEQLESLIEELESPSIDIDDALKTHKQAKEVIKELQDYLKNADAQIKKAINDK